MKRLWRKWKGQSKKTKILLLFLVLLTAVVVFLGLNLRDACDNVRRLEQDVSRSEAALKTVKKEKTDLEEQLVQRGTRVLQLEREIEALLDCAIFPELSVEKWTRIGAGQWQTSVRARPGDSVQFRILIRGVAKNVRLREFLPSEISVTYVTVDGKRVTGDISDLTFREIYGQTEIIISGRVDPRLGEKTLVNRVVVWADCVEELSAEVTIEVKPRPVPPSSCCKPAPPKDKCDEGGPKNDPDPNK